MQYRFNVSIFLFLNFIIFKDLILFPIYIHGCWSRSITCSSTWPNTDKRISSLTKTDWLVTDQYVPVDIELLHWGLRWPRTHLNASPTDRAGSTDSRAPSRTRHEWARNLRYFGQPLLQPHLLSHRHVPAFAISSYPSLSLYFPRPQRLHLDSEWNCSRVY